ncbi:MAG: glycoside hydrolase family 31 protein [Rikenellaceae bacterium]
MKKTTIIPILFTSLALSSCADFEKGESGITLQRGDMTINVEVIDESIIHVTKSREGVEVEELPDYVTVLEPQDVKWCVSVKGGKINLSTAKVELSIDKRGVIDYRDKSGRTLLSESREATWIDPSENPDYPVSQGFVASDEAIYGLGQYQSGVMNLRAVSISMDQFNQEIVIPFIVSTNGYGLYWHNYSITEFNRPQNTLSFEPKRIDKGEAEELDSTAEVEDVAQHKAKKVANIIRTTTFTPSKSGLYTFLVKSDINTRMRGTVNLVIDSDTLVHYSTIWMPMHFSGSKELTAGKEYSVTFQNDGASIAGEVFFNEPDFDKTTFTSSVGDKIEYYFVAGENPEQVLYNYQNLTGRAPMFPKKSYGFWHCRERFNTQAELLENAREYRKRGIPVDNIVQDWHYWPDGTKGPEWDRKQYPDPEAMCSELAELDMNLMVSVWPMMNNKGIVDKYDISELVMENAGYYLDFYNERTGPTFYRILSDSMFHFGVKSIWLDGSEPERVPLTTKTIFGDFAKVANPYSLLVSKGMYEGRREEFPNERVFNLTRSAYSGQQRYGVTSWSGDVAATWEQLAEQISAGLNFSVAGVPYWTHDIGGFFRDSKSLNPIYDNQYTNVEFKELMSRWFQFGALSPIFRIHGYKSNTEVWRYGAEFEALARKYIDLRYALLPYIYSEAWRVTTESNLLISPLGYSYPEDQRVWNIFDQYLFGESIMVCPVVEYRARTKRIYLPEGEWFNFWSDEKLKGGREVELSAELDELPMLVKAGSIIPFGPKVQSADEQSSEPLRIKIYGGADAKFDLYLDEGESYDYEKGVYSILTISYDHKSGKVKLESHHDKYVDFAKNPIALIIESAEGAEPQKVIFDSTTQTIKL